MLVEEMTYMVGTRVLLWRLEEEPQQLLALCREQGIPVEDLEELPAKRQRERRPSACCFAVLLGGR